MSAIDLVDIFYEAYLSANDLVDIFNEACLNEASYIDFKLSGFNLKDYCLTLVDLIEPA